jgi:hypothetical protein
MNQPAPASNAPANQAPANQAPDQTPADVADEQALDEALEETFPASDPVAIDTGPPVKIDAPAVPRK